MPKSHHELAESIFEAETLVRASVSRRLPAGKSQTSAPLIECAFQDWNSPVADPFSSRFPDYGFLIEQVVDRSIQYIGLSKYLLELMEYAEPDDQAIHVVLARDVKYVAQVLNDLWFDHELNGKKELVDGYEV